MDKRAESAIMFGKELAEVLKAIDKGFKVGRDDPIKSVRLALVAAELNVIKYKDGLRKFGVNHDDKIEESRLYAREQASCLYEGFRQMARPGY